MTDATKNPPGFLFQLTCDCGNGKTIAVSGNWPSDIDITKINADIDLINVAFDRQRAKHEAPLIEERIEGTQQEIDRVEAELDAYLKKHPETHKSRDHGLIRKMELQIVQMKVAKTRGEITLAATQAKAA